VQTTRGLQAPSSASCAAFLGGGMEGEVEGCSRCAELREDSGARAVRQSARLLNRGRARVDSYPESSRFRHGSAPARA